MSKTAIIETWCTATVLETWRITVPDDFDPTEHEDVLQAAMDAGPIERVDNDVHDERERSFKSVTLEDVPEPVPTIYTDAYGTTTQAIYDLCRGKNVTPADYDDLVEEHGRANYEAILADLQRRTR